MDKTFAVHNFGCKVNQQEGSSISALLQQNGWHEDSLAPQAIIINTCTVTAMADKKARNLIRRLHQQQPQALIAVCGCYAQRSAAEIAAIPGVDIIVGTEERRDLPVLLQRFIKDRQQLIRVGEIAESRVFRSINSASLQKRARAYLKIEDGCDQFCHYCIIPHVRGPVRSLPLNQAVEQAEQLLAAGHREIVLSGIHIGAYGSDLAEGEDLPALIRALLVLPGLQRLRLGSIEPQQFSTQLIELIAREPKICAHLHIPLQSGSDKILAAMGRRYRRSDYARLLEQLQQRRADLAITSDIMVGFPGESEEDFADTCSLLRDLDLAALHIFPYSRRSGTPAAELPGQLPQQIKARRAAQLAAFAGQLERDYAQRFLGRTLDLLPEEIVELDGEKYLRGHSHNYLVLLLPWQEEFIPGEILLVRAKICIEQGLIAELS